MTGTECKRMIKSWANTAGKEAVIKALMKNDIGYSTAYFLANGNYHCDPKGILPKLQKALRSA